MCWVTKLYKNYGLHNQWLIIPNRYPDIYYIQGYLLWKILWWWGIATGKKIKNKDLVKIRKNIQGKNLIKNGVNAFKLHPFGWWTLKKFTGVIRSPYPDTPPALPRPPHICLPGEKWISYEGGAGGWSKCTIYTPVYISFYVSAGANSYVVTKNDIRSVPSREYELMWQACKKWCHFSDAVYIFRF